MFEEMIVNLRDLTRDIDTKQNKKLNIDQFTGLLVVLTDKKLIDGTEAAKGIQIQIEENYKALNNLLRTHELDKVALKAYKKSYANLIVKVKEVFNLEPIGNIQGQYMGIGVAIGTSIGVALMASISPAFMSIGTGIGIAIGAAFGSMKEKEAKEEGRLF